MRIRIVGLLTGLLVGLPALGALYAQSRARAQPQYQVAALHALLFYSDRGQFSTNVIGRSDLALWNTPVGAGDAGAPSNATLVIVEIEGPPEQYVERSTVTLTATAGQSTLLRRTESVGVFNQAGRHFVGFWLYDTGCEPISLIARTPGQRTPSRAEIPFHCGE